MLARDSPLKGPLQLGDWLQRLLYFAADAAAARDPPLASRALDGFSAAAMVRAVPSRFQSCPTVSPDLRCTA